ncbi:NAD(+)/NADH kinase [Acrocarpospora catenulata]|uniref:NAD(+)/NADH kinase n=1 Tax=Acrocarpospora catenulata TaxID=2836182 RepID=UPI00202399D8|nr:NAD(+)/NADH kinase [Acrocarpospora catenulata]
MGMVKTVGIVLHPRRNPREAIDTIIEWARLREVTVLGLYDEVDRIDCSAVPVDAATLAGRSNLLVSLGGDGTMLRAMRLNTGRSTPVLGVNVGKLGFLAEIDVHELAPALSAIDNRRYTVEPRMAVQTMIPGTGEVRAFNDIALVRTPGEGLAAVAVAVDGVPFVRFAADAVIVATATGSTAYSFSAGGPIVSPTVSGFLVVPAAAHSTFNRTMMLSVDEEVTLEVLPSSGPLAVEVDGQVAGRLTAGQALTVSAQVSAAYVVRLGTTTFYERARRKLQVIGSAEAY